jgi:Domain of unknown function (DUF5911)
MVTLKNVWISGAWAWTTSKRESFANDVSDPQLFAVTDNVNESKGDKSPDAWKSPLTSYYCTYAKAWTRNKYIWKLTITTTEKTALTSISTPADTGRYVYRHSPAPLTATALVADGQCGAIIGPSGDFVWLCAPRWDSDAISNTMIGGRDRARSARRRAAIVIASMG